MPLPDALLAALDLDVFERRADGTFHRLGTPPPWSAGAFPEGDGAVALRASAFLDGFLIDADGAWRSGEPLASGSFSEPGADGTPRVLEARALSLDGRDLLLLGPPTVSRATTQRVLQTARDQSLAAEAERKRTAERETLLHCIVHDLSNPLAGLRGSLQLLGETAEGDDAELAAIGLRAADRMQATIRSVLGAFAASVDPLLPSAEVPVADLAAAVQRAVDAAGPSARAAGVVLSLDGLSSTKLDRTDGNLSESDRVKADSAAHSQPDGAPSPCPSPAGRGDIVSDVGSGPEAPAPSDRPPCPATGERPLDRSPGQPSGSKPGGADRTPPPLPVVAEAERLERAVANLLANAIRHARREVRVELRHDATRATVSVRDDGPGIAPELRPHLFRPFAQGARGGAVGLGLHSVRLAAQAWGGAAGETPAARGAHFWLRLARA